MCPFEIVERSVHQFFFYEVKFFAWKATCHCSSIRRFRECEIKIASENLNQRLHNGSIFWKFRDMLLHYFELKREGRFLRTGWISSIHCRSVSLPAGKIGKIKIEKFRKINVYYKVTRMSYRELTIVAIACEVAKRRLRYVNFQIHSAPLQLLSGWVGSFATLCGPITVRFSLSKYEHAIFGSCSTSQYRRIFEFFHSYFCDFLACHKSDDNPYSYWSFTSEGVVNHRKSENCKFETIRTTFFRRFWSESVFIGHLVLNC